MKAYKFANLPSNSYVDAGVTMLVSVWFLVAAAAILGDPSSTYTHRTQAQAAPAARAAAPAPTSVAIAPQARETIIVRASRSATL